MQFYTHYLLLALVSVLSTSAGSVGHTNRPPQISASELYRLTTKFIDSFMYPNNIQQAKLVNSTFFSPNILGRVDATRDFKGPELNTEYIYGLFAGIPSGTSPSQTPTTNAATPSTISSFFTLLGLPTSYKITHFAATQNIVSTSIINTFSLPFLNTTLPIEVILWLTFTSDGRISQYDATFRYLAWELATGFSIAQKKFNLDAPTLQQLVTQRLATSICDIEALSCKGPNKQYASKGECMEFLTKSVRFGQAYELGMNTLLCRMVHQGMVPLRPDVHCPHIGPSGGAYCVDDRTYEGVVRDEAFWKNGGFVPRGLRGW